MSRILLLISVLFLSVPSVYANEHLSHGNGFFRQWHFDRQISELNKTDEREFRKADEIKFGKVWINVHRDGDLNFFSIVLGDSSSVRHLAFQYVQLGNEEMLQKEFAQAVADFTKAIEIDPQLSVVYYFRAGAYFREDEYSNALTDINKAEELGYSVSPLFTDLVNQAATRQAARIYYSLGRKDLSQENFAQAIAEFTKALEIDPAYKMVYYCRGVAYFGEMDFSNALADINQAEELGVIVSPVLISAIKDHSTSSGADYAPPNNYVQLIAEYTQAIKINPNDPRLYVERGHCYRRQHNDPQAIADYTKAIEIDPKFADAYRRRGASYFFMKEYNKSWADEMKAQDLGLIINPGLIGALKCTSSALFRHNFILQQEALRLN